MTQVPRKLTAVIVALFGTLATFGVCMAGVGWVSGVTHSGPLGICGPYGDHVGLIILLFLASIPVSVAGGVCLAQFNLWLMERRDKSQELVR